MVDLSKMNTSSYICLLPLVLETAGIVVSIQGNSLPAILLAVVGMLIGIAMSHKDRSGLGGDLSLVFGCSGAVFTIAYVVLSRVAYLAVQSF